ncbi:unnamed protein product [Mesocestoides corti]|uniref:Ras-GAP domain-containing protein n=1 Tax=Mesocestoides corti TaxID=53468 RepID=A0A158QSC7_MESCO|nr:unnamed protein product [Mesocestoides corti]
MRSELSTLNEKLDRSRQQGLVIATSQPSVYLSPDAVKGTWRNAATTSLPKGDKLTRAHSAAYDADDCPSNDTELLKRRATTLDIDMSTKGQGKAASRRRLFGLFSKQSNSSREKANDKVTRESVALESLPQPGDDSKRPVVLQALVESLERHKADLKFAVSPLHDSVVQGGGGGGGKNCFQISTFLPMPKSQSRPTNGLRDPHRDRITSLTRRWTQERSQSITSMDDDDDDDGVASTVCLRRPAPGRNRLTKQATGDVQEPHSVHRIYSCSSPAERNYWLHKFQCFANPRLCSEKHFENHLHLSIQEIKGVPSGNEYFCEIYLDDALYAQTPLKTMTQTLSWSEDFDFSHLSQFSELRIFLWMSKPIPIAEKSTNRRASLPRSGVVNGGDQSSTYRLSIPNHADSMMSIESENCRSIFSNSSSENFAAQEDLRSRKRRRLGGIWSKKTPADLYLIGKFVVPAAEITGIVDVEAWYSSAMDAADKRRSFVDHCAPASVSFEGHNPTAHASSAKRLSRAGVQLSRKTLAQLERSPPRLRLSACYSSVSVLPLCGYASLLASLSTPDTCTAYLRSLEPWLSVRSKAALAKSLLGMLQLRGQVPAFLSALVLSEVQEQDNPNMVLRSNSLATKAIELYLKQIGGNYLKVALGGFVASVLSRTATAVTTCQKEKRNSLGRRQMSRPSSDDIVGPKSSSDFEVDPEKVTNSGQLLRNQANLMRLVRDVWQRIQNTVSEFPNDLRRTFAAIREAMLPANASWKHTSGDETDVRGLFEHVVSACVFLRFICPAILSPSLFGLADGLTEDPRAVRTFTLVAKAILNLANFTLFGDVKELHMDFLNRFVAEEIPTMRSLLWRLSEPISQLGGSVESSNEPLVHTAQLVDVLTVLKRPSPAHAENTVSLSDSPLSTLPDFCSLCSAITLECECHRQKSQTNFPETSASSSNVQVIRHQWLMELQDLQSDAAVCRQAICGIPPQLTATRRALELEQLQLAVSLAHCHAQLDAVFKMVPIEALTLHSSSHFKKLNQPLKALGSILASLTHLNDLDTKTWHAKHMAPPCPQQPACQGLDQTTNELASGVSALSLAKSQSRREFTPRARELEGVPVENGTPKPEPTTIAAKAKSTQLIEQRNAYHLKVLGSNQTLSSTFNTSSEPGPLCVSGARMPQADDCSTQITTNSRLTATTNESSWSLLHATHLTPSHSSQPPANNQTFYSDSSCASMTLPSPLGSSSSGSGRPSNCPIMGTGLYTGNCGMQRSCTYPSGNQQAFVEANQPPQASNKSSNTSRRTFVSAQTQTSCEQVTELDETHRDQENLRRTHRPQRKHLYINILGDFESGKVKR